MIDILADRYRRLASLGEGAMGEVWLADDLVLGRRVAVKQLRVNAGTDTAPVERMVREARTAARLHHPNAVSVHDLVTVDGQPYLIMEYVEGETLDERLRRVGRLPVADACAIAAQVARALEAAHSQGVVHRDVKPANVMLTANGVAKLGDFGIARHESDTSLTATGNTIGTLAYMAPETVGSGPATAASDVWSLGATLYAALEGHPPYLNGDDDTSRLLYRLVTEPPPPAPHAGPAAPLLAWMLDRESSRRPSAGEAARRLAVASVGPPAQPVQPSAVVTHPRSQSPAPTTAIRAVPPSRPTRWRAIIALVAVVVLAAVGLTTYLVTSGSGGTTPRSNSSAPAPSTSRSSAPPFSAPNTVSALPGAVFANPTQVTRILADARTDITALFSYDYRHLDEHDQQVSDLTTGQFHNDYLDLTKTAIDPIATRDQIVLSARATAVGMGPFDGTTATVVVFDDTTRTDRTGATLTNGYVTTLSLQQVFNSWLVAGMDQDGGVQTDPPGSAGVAAATAAARRDAVLLTSLDKTTVNTRLAELKAGATGGYLRDFDASTKPARTAAATGGESTNGTVVTYGVSAAGGASADVLVEVKQTGTRSGKAFAPRRVRLELTMTRVDGAWLVSAVQTFP